MSTDVDSFPPLLKVSTPNNAREYCLAIFVSPKMPIDGTCPVVKRLAKRGIHSNATDWMVGGEIYLAPTWCEYWLDSPYTSPWLKLETEPRLLDFGADLIGHGLVVASRALEQQLVGVKHAVITHLAGDNRLGLVLKQIGHRLVVEHDFDS